MLGEISSVHDPGMSHDVYYGRPAAYRRDIELLTKREREVMFHLLLGSAVKRVAFVLGISPRTAEKHRAAIYQKLGIYSQPKLICYGCEAFGSFDQLLATLLNKPVSLFTPCHPLKTRQQA